MGKQASIRRPKKRSTAQQSQSRFLRKGNKENVPPTPAPKKPVQQPRDYKRDFQNLQRKHRHTLSYKTKLQLALDNYKTKYTDTKKAADLAKRRESELQRREAALQGALDKALSKSVKETGLSKDAIVALRTKNKALQQRVKDLRGFWPNQLRAPNQSLLSAK
jgi:hypothetical protein